jgi:predicted GIY-YIG superfamily endonuclease
LVRGAVKYVYILVSEGDVSRFYVGLTDNVLARLEKHNAGHVPHTSKFSPWRLKNSIGFADADKAAAFEKYLKSGSGRAFAKKHF